MISTPSCAQIVQSVRDELNDTITPALSDPGLLATLGMIDALLQTVVGRLDHELAWMREEIAAIEQLAATLIDDGADRDGTVAGALAHLLEARTDSDHLPDVQAQYSLATEVLSCCIDIAVPLGGEVRTQTEAVLQARLDREVRIRGDFSLVGR